MVVGDSAKEAYTEFAQAAAERRAKGEESAPVGAKKVQRPPTNVDGGPPALTIKVNGASNTGSQSSPWVLGSDVRANNGIISAAKPEALTTAGPRLGDVPTRYGTIRTGNAESSSLLLRAALLSPPLRESPSRGMSISRSPSAVTPLRMRGSPGPAQGDSMYDDILGEYGEAEDPGAPRRKPTTAGGAGPSRAVSTKTPMSAGFNNPRMARQKTMASSYSRSPRVSMYEEDADVPLRVIKVKVCHTRVSSRPATHPH